MTWGRFVFYVKNATSGMVTAVKFGSAGGKAVSLLPKRAPGDSELYVWSIQASCGPASAELDVVADGKRGCPTCCQSPRAHPCDGALGVSAPAGVARRGR